MQAVILLSMQLIHYLHELLLNNRKLSELKFYIRKEEEK